MDFFICCQYHKKEGVCISFCWDGVVNTAVVPGRLRWCFRPGIAVETPQREVAGGVEKRGVATESPAASTSEVGRLMEMNW
ncbi:hypothetical protein DMA11_12630 [Marinilabiliaceae bacterium JC017]|nr:hypothetical protein DMA11_12630 [Marinilabiliaceae bacterium JC017]